MPLTLAASTSPLLLSTAACNVVTAAWMELGFVKPGTVKDIALFAANSPELSVTVSTCPEMLADPDAPDAGAENTSAVPEPHATPAPIIVIFNDEGVGRVIGITNCISI